MRQKANQIAGNRLAGLLARLARDTAGNTIAMIAAALLPLLAMVGGGIDMSRSYLSQARLQQACDAGVLAARKRLGSAVVTDGNIPADVATVGNQFFNVNFLAGAYGTEDRTFTMTLEDDYAISGVASVEVPTTIMTIFGFTEVPVEVACEAKLNFSNTDIMFVLDTTGSMAQTNPGDSEPRIEALRDVVTAFHAQVEGSKGAGTRVRYGFVPYSTNVNVGGLLEDDWVVTNWGYQSRERIVTGTTTGTRSYAANWQYVSGNWTPWTVQSTYTATYHPPNTYWIPPSSTTNSDGATVTTPGRWQTDPAWYSCDNPTPSNTLTESNKVLLGTDTEPFAGPPAGTRTIQHYRTQYDGTQYSTTLSGSTCSVNRSTATAYIATFDWVTEPTQSNTEAWLYRRIPQDVSNWRTQSNGCIEERSTYEINDYDNVDFSRALDLDIDLVPTADEDTQWRPMYPNIVFARSMRWDGTGSFTPADVTTNDDYVNPSWAGLSACPAPARRLGEMTASEVATYVNSLQADGSTYHDIGMIWGGRLLSPTGLFAADNADVDGKPTARHMIFLTDGETAPLDLSYSTYGVEPLDQRRWSEGSALSLTETVEERFAVACKEVKKRNITVWVIGFGTTLNPIMTECAGPGKSFEADDTSELNEIFSRIAASIGDLRVSR